MLNNRVYDLKFAIKEAKSYVFQIYDWFMAFVDDSLRVFRDRIAVEKFFPKDSWTNEITV